MNKIVQSLAVLSTVFLLAACHTPSGSSSDMSGNGSANNGPVTPGSESDLTQNVGDRVFFAFDSSQLSNEGQQTLQRQAAWLKQYPNVKVTVEGHCDQRGTREYNLALGERRADAAKKYLASEGINASRISTISYGKERPVCVEANEDCWAKNRRAVTVLMNQ